MEDHQSTRKRGQGMVEYALIIVLVAVVLIVVLSLVGSQVSQVFSYVIQALAGPTSSSGSSGSPAPPECYGTLLLPLMMGVTGATVLVSSLLDKVRRSQLT